MRIDDFKKYLEDVYRQDNKEPLEKSTIKSQIARVSAMYNKHGLDLDKKDDLKKALEKFAGKSYEPTIKKYIKFCKGIG